jgi:hypothetical protein
LKVFVLWSFKDAPDVVSTPLADIDDGFRASQVEKDAGEVLADI